MHFVKLRWLNSFSRQLMAASAGGVSVPRRAAGGRARSRFSSSKESCFPKSASPNTPKASASSCNSTPQGRPVAVDLEQMPWLYESLGKEVTFRVLDEAGAVLLSSEPGAPPLTAPGEPLVLGDHNFLFVRGGIGMNGATEAVSRDGRTLWCSSR